MKALWNDTVIAETPKENLIRIEGNWYFPPESMKKEYFKDSDHKTTCIWKGEASYFDVVINGKTNDYGAWYYAQPKDGSIERVKDDYTNYVAFWNGITVTE
ncbi:MAG: hypothetical protein JWN75_772 [Candidatus Saccharibacteria bacterium]|nr:hypothetical protein [Candidatus Saccharibacteria bacterium]